MRILAIDQASKCGWATDDLSGMENFSLKRGDSPGMRFLRFRSWLEEMLRITKPDLIVYEMPHHRGGNSTEVAYGFVTEIKTAAANHKINITTIHSGTLKKWACGHGKASKKDMVKEAKKQTGRKISDDNEADAVLMHLCVKEQNQRKSKITRRKK